LATREATDGCLAVEKERVELRETMDVADRDVEVVTPRERQADGLIKLTNIFLGKKEKHTGRLSAGCT
jgi:hypothetical protein